MISRQANINNIVAFTCSLDRKVNAESVAIIYERMLTRTFWIVGESFFFFYIFLFYVNCSDNTIGKERAFLRQREQ